MAETTDTQMLRPSFLGALRQLFSHLSPRRRRQLGPVIALMLAGAVAEVVSLGAILPFLAVISNPDQAVASEALQPLLQLLGLDSRWRLVVAAAALFAASAVVAACVRLLLLWVSQEYVFAMAKELSVAIYSRTLHQPYAYHTEHNSSVTLGAINKAQIVIVNLLVPLMNAASAVVIAVFLLAGLLYVDPLMAVASGIGFSAIYVGVMRATRKVMRRNSGIIAVALQDRLQAAGEGLGGIRDVLLDRSQPVFVARFAEVEDRLRAAQGMNVFVAAAPRFVVEGLGLLLIAGLSLVLGLRSGGLIAAIPVLGALALGAQRLLPLLQQIFVGWSAYAGAKQSLHDVLDILRLPSAPEAETRQERTPLAFGQAITLEGVGFRYTGQTRAALHDVDLVIPKGARVGFIGKTGSGKSTLMDLLLGLLIQSEGRILVDGVELSDANRAAWQARVAHVPQAIYLADATVAENIAFGVPKADIDLDRVRRAAEQAELADVIAALPDGYENVVGERGVRLSGGQRQRIGIARALYKEADVLIFDEATSALDNETERAVMRAIDALDRDLTVLIIAHRLSTVERCDQVVELQGGRVVPRSALAANLAMSAGA